jgi:hypothetical protein
MKARVKRGFLFSVQAEPEAVRGMATGSLRLWRTLSLGSGSPWSIIGVSHW